MKSLYESLLDDFDTIASKIDPEDTIIQYLQANYFGCKKEYVEMKLGEDGKYIVNLYNDLTPRKIKLKEITNGMFVFGVIRGSVDFEGTQISSLEGSPREVQGFFDCSYCPNLKSLKGGPKMVDGAFYCTNCGKQFKEKDIMNAKIIVQGGINI